jgi:hypothetical protein
VPSLLRGLPGRFVVYSLFGGRSSDVDFIVIGGSRGGAFSGRGFRIDVVIPLQTLIIIIILIIIIGLSALVGPAYAPYAGHPGLNLYLLPGWVFLYSTAPGM